MRVLTILITAATLLIPVAGQAQQPQPLVTIEDEIAAARKLLVQEWKLVIAGELVLTPEESKDFWPVFNEYLEESSAIGDSRLALITDFAKNYADADDDYAAQLLNDALDIESQKLKLRKKYVKRFKKVLPTLKVAKLYQVESKLNAALDYQLATQIPIIGR